MSHNVSYRIGDIIEHADGSIYVIKSKLGDTYNCGTIVEQDATYISKGLMYHFVSGQGQIKVIGHIE